MTRRSNSAPCARAQKLSRRRELRQKRHRPQRLDRRERHSGAGGRRRVSAHVETVERQCAVRHRSDRKSTRLNPVTNAHLVCRLLLEKKKKKQQNGSSTNKQ